MAKATGHSLTRVVVDALEQYGERFRRRMVDKRGIHEILKRVHSRPTRDHRSPEEIIGYNKRGHFD